MNNTVNSLSVCFTCRFPREQCSVIIVTLFTSGHTPMSLVRFWQVMSRICKKAITYITMRYGKRHQQIGQIYSAYIYQYVKGRKVVIHAKCNSKGMNFNTRSQQLVTKHVTECSYYALALSHNTFIHFVLIILIFLCVCLLISLKKLTRYTRYYNMCVHSCSYLARYQMKAALHWWI